MNFSGGKSFFRVKLFGFNNPMNIHNGFPDSNFESLIRVCRCIVANRDGYKSKEHPKKTFGNSR